MNLLADENIDRGIVVRLRAGGHAVVWVAELSSGITDEDVLRLAVAGPPVLITEDKDFGELVYRRGLAHAGVVLVRLAGMDNAAKAATVSEAIRDTGEELIAAFAVISPDAVRVRRPSS